MLYAHNELEERIQAQPNRLGWCPICEGQLTPKCGKITKWHWSHKQSAECDPWFESETFWHLSWKEIVKPENTEVRIGNHRADIVGMDRLVIELQHSQIPPSEIQERENFYGKMIWLLDASIFHNNLIFFDKGDYHTFRWKWPRKSWAFAQKPVYLDLGDGRIFAIKKLYPAKAEKFVQEFDDSGNFLFAYISSRKPCAGWGEFISIFDFLKKYFVGSLKKRDHAK